MSRHFAAALCKRLPKQELQKRGQQLAGEGLSEKMQNVEEETANICVNNQNYCFKSVLYALSESGQALLIHITRDQADQLLHNSLP